MLMVYIGLRSAISIKHHLVTYRHRANAILYMCLFHHEGSTKSVTDKKIKSDRTRARGMYTNIKSYLTNTLEP